MEFLKDIALPQSAEHIQLLHYMLILVLFLFVPFISVIFWGTGISLYFKSKEIRELDDNCRKFSKDIIELVTINKSVGIILGVVPLLTSILIFAQLFQGTEGSNLNYLSTSLVLVIIALLFIYNYRYSFGELRKQSVSSGVFGFIMLFVSLWFFSTGLTEAVFYNYWKATGTLSDLFSPLTIIRFLFLLVSSLALTGGAVLFGFFYLEGKKETLTEDYAVFIKRKTISITFAATVLIPLLMFINLFIVPGSMLSGAVFAYIIIGLFLLFLGYHFLYMIFARFSSKFTALLFFTLLFLVMSIIINDQLVISNATKVNSAMLANQYDEMLKELKGVESPAELNGEEIYKVRCASCHKFDQKLVGPPHNEVVPKYFGKEKQLIAYIRNPVKVDPNYPPMPNPGLRPNEAKAIADYILEKVKENVGQ